jgi:predicted nucleic acid-binding Zn ribbon protein
MFEDMGSLLPKAVKRAGIHKQVDSAHIIEAAEKVFQSDLPEGVSRDLKPAFVRHSTLAVAVLSGAAAQELHFREDEILGAINKRLGREVVKKLKYLT